MKKPFVKFLLKLSLFTLLTGLAGFVLKLLLPGGTLPQSFFLILLFFYTVTLAVHYTLLKITFLSPRKFVSYFMLTTLAKLIFYFIAILAYVFIVKENLVPFLISFFILYLFFTVFEVVSILRQAR